jgi:hypothetical protein
MTISFSKEAGAFRNAFDGAEEVPVGLSASTKLLHHSIKSKSRPVFPFLAQLSGELNWGKS